MTHDWPPKNAVVPPPSTPTEPCPMCPTWFGIGPCILCGRSYPEHNRGDVACDVAAAYRLGGLHGVAGLVVNVPEHRDVRRRLTSHWRCSPLGAQFAADGLAILGLKHNYGPSA